MIKGLRELMTKQISLFVGLSSAIAVVHFRGFQNNQSSNWRCLELVWWKNQHEGIVGNVCRTKVKTGIYWVVYLFLLRLAFRNCWTSLSVCPGSCKRPMVQCMARWRQLKRVFKRYRLTLTLTQTLTQTLTLTLTLTRTRTRTRTRTFTFHWLIR